MPRIIIAVIVGVIASHALYFVLRMIYRRSNKTKMPTFIHNFFD